MGGYFGVRNKTQGQAISSYWKGYPPHPAELREIADKMGWDLKKDVIYSGSYCGYYNWDHKSGDWSNPNTDEDEDDDTTYELFDAEGNLTTNTTFYFN